MDGNIVEVEMLNVDCVICGVLFSITKTYYNFRIRDGVKFCCPNGHEQNYTIEPSENEKRLQERIKELGRINVALLSKIDQMDAAHGKQG